MPVKNIPIFAKVLLIVASFGALMVASTIFSTIQMQRIGRSYAEAIARGGQAALLTSRIDRAVYTAYAAVGELVISSSGTGNTVAFEHLGQARVETVNYLDKLGALGPEYAEIASRIRSEALRVIDQDCANTISRGRGSTADDIAKAQAAYQTECKVRFDPLSKMIRADTDKLTATEDKTSVDLETLTHKTVLTTFAVVIGGTSLLLVFAFFATRAWISRPLRELTAVMERLAKGDNAVNIPDPNRRDEAGAMARTLLVFRDAALDKLRVESESAAQRHEAEAQRTCNEEAKAEQSRLLTKVVESLADGLGRISEGDLTIRLDERFALEYERLRSDFNAAVQQMQNALSAIVSSAWAISSGTGEISQAAEDLSRRTEQQAASLEQTAAALEQITTTVKRAAEGASHARTVVSRTRSDAEQSGLVVERAVGAMSEIEKSSQQISQIIGVIDEIAFQTNLLALNAGVEAARAGEAGRGFAVVASEVRALAQRSAEAAREIKRLISASTQQVDAGVKLVGETGVALKRIVTQVGEVDGVVSEIAASAQEQAIGLGEVNTAVTLMDQVTQQNAAMVEESTAASRTLANEAEALAKLTSHFQLGHPSDSAGASAKATAVRRSEPARPAPRPAKPPARRSNAALAVVAASSAPNDWQEF